MITGVFSAIAWGHFVFAGVEKETTNSQKPDAWENARAFGKRLDQATIGTEPIDPRNPPTLAIWLLDFGSGQLVVLADYFNLTAHKITLHGRRIQDPVGDSRRFYPDANLEVSAEIDRDWRVIGRSPAPGQGIEATAVILPVKLGGANPQAKRNETCVIDMNPFRAVVGKYRYGRVVLKDGGTSQVLVLTDLLPPENR
jgi:hypothetical protein